MKAKVKKSTSLIFCLIIVMTIIASYAVSSMAGAETFQNQAQNDEQIIKLNLLSQIKKEITTQAGSGFVDLAPEAIKIGLQDAQLYGQIVQKILPDKTTRMFIKWHSIGIPTTGSNNLIDTLDSPLQSQFRTKDSKVEPGSIISATGDLQGLIDKFLELKERAKTETPKHVVEEKDEDEDEDKTGSSSDYGSNGNTSSAGDSSGLEGEFSTNKISSSWEDCEPKVSTADGVVYRQAREVETGEDGSVVSVGDCVNQGGSAPIQKVYGECPMVFDFANRKAYEPYSEYAELDGEKIMVTNCTNDFSRSYAIYAKKSDCGTRNDLDAGKSFPQEKLYYTDSNGQEHELTDCMDADKSYKIFMTSMTCTTQVDNAAKLVTVYKRPAYYLDNGTIEYAGDCKAVEQVPIQKEYGVPCTIIYDFEEKKVYEQYREFAIVDGKEIEITPCSTDAARTYTIYSKPSACSIRHDTAAGKSYVQEDLYYRGSDGVEIKLKECQDSDISYDHFLTEDTCTLEIDRENNKVTQFKRLAYKKPDGTTEYINECQPVGIFPLEKIYGDPCPVIYDLENKKAYVQYREIVVLPDETRELISCTNDFEKPFDIYSKPSDCEIRDDFTVNKSYPQEKLYYTDSTGKEIQISECQDSEVSYDHFLTEMTCSPDIDLANGKVTPFKRVAYYLPSGEVAYASECRAADDGSYPILEDFCEPKYEHNFTTGQSYYRTRDYYIKDATPIYLSECLVSTAASFPHTYNSSSCGLINDDAALRSTQKTSTIIETPDGEIEISPCQDNGVFIPYIYIGIENRTKVFTSSTTWTAPASTSSVGVFAVAGGGSGGNGGASFPAAGSDGIGQNGGKGAVWSTSNNFSGSGAGGGGGAGEQVNQTVNVSPGQTITITIGKSNQNTTFGSLVTASYNKGSMYNGAPGTDAIGYSGPGDGGDGYGTAALAKDGSCGTWGVPYPGSCSGPYSVIGIAGKGYGAGGGGGLGNFTQNTLMNATAGGAGAPGYMKITYSVNKYRRADDTIYIQE